MTQVAVPEAAAILARRAVRVARAGDVRAVGGVRPRRGNAGGDRQELAGRLDHDSASSASSSMKQYRLEVATKARRRENP